MGRHEPDEPESLAEIDAAALHLARITDGTANSASCRRWAARIRRWAARYPDRITDHGRRGRRRLYDLAELEELAAALGTGHRDQRGRFTTAVVDGR